MSPLTGRQSEVLSLIAAHIEQKGYPPTRMEICEAMGFRSPNSAECHLKALKQKKVIQMIPGSARGIRLLVNADEVPAPKPEKSKKPSLDGLLKDLAGNPGMNGFSRTVYVNGIRIEIRAYKADQKGAA